MRAAVRAAGSSMACKGSGVQSLSSTHHNGARRSLVLCSTSPRLRGAPDWYTVWLEGPGETRLRDLGPPVGPELVERVVDDLPHMPIGICEEPVGPTQRSGSGPLDHDSAGSDGLLERGVDLAVGGHMDGQDRFAGRLARQRSGHLLAAELGQEVVGADQQEATGR